MRGRVGRGVHTIMHEHPVGEVLVHPFDAKVEYKFYAILTFEDRDDGLLNKQMSRSAAS